MKNYLILPDNHKDTTPPSSASPKTNEDFNKKPPHPGNKELKINSGAAKGEENKDLLEDENADSGDSDGNGNLINEYDDEVIDEKINKDIPATDTRTNTKNPDAREI